MCVVTRQEFTRAVEAVQACLRSVAAESTATIGAFLDSKVEAGQLSADVAESCKADNREAVDAMLARVDDYVANETRRLFAGNDGI